uniref:Transposase IS4 family protein n=1 Tax=Heterorhabditis bacteriophora TaxID=37862 RepID=A0A1I7X337_HETBA
MCDSEYIALQDHAQARKMGVKGPREPSWPITPRYHAIAIILRYILIVLRNRILQTVDYLDMRKNLIAVHMIKTSLAALHDVLLAAGPYHPIPAEPSRTTAKVVRKGNFARCAWYAPSPGISQTY